MSNLAVESIVSQLEFYLKNDDGYELYPFKVSHYNKYIGEEFKLNENEDTLCILILSTPKWFTNSFVKFLKKTCHKRNIKTYDDFQEKLPNPVSDCVSSCVEKGIKNLIDYDPQVFYDHSINPWTRKPYIIMASAGHAAGATYYYTKNDCLNLVPSDEERISNGKKKLIGIAMHNKYGGNFAFRCVLLFRNVLVPNLPQIVPYKALDKQEKIANLILSFNDHWMNGEFRNLGEDDNFKYEEKYCATQLNYFNSPLLKRWEIIQEMIQR
uniref:Cyanocobalamin reductase (cyanide-eliminating) n=1 Tax=Parastrongyloides trichosuri TaxID=131310 RepID=A0A0N4ZRJ2_PARTI